MNTLEIIFYALSAFAIISAIMVLVSKNPIHSVLWLILVFVIMLMKVKKDNEPQKYLVVKLIGVIAGGSFLTLLIALVKQNSSFQGKDVLLKEGSIGLIHPLGQALFTDYVVPFEISSVLFLSAMVGAVIIGKK